MDVSTTSFSPIQVTLALILLVLLLSWFIIFTALAIHGYLMKKVDWEVIPTTTRSIPIIGIQPPIEHPDFAEMTGSAKHQDYANSERPSDSGTTFFK